MLRKVAFAVCFAILWFVPAAQAQESHPVCSTKELNNRLRPSDPAYADATALAATLQNHGSTILCVLPSKFAQFLPPQTGAALFRTSIGDFEALFRPKEQNFDDVFISEERDENLSGCSSEERDENLSSCSNTTSYRYTFRDPHGRKVQDICCRETFFMARHNIFFIIWQKNTTLITAMLTESLGDER